MALDKNGHEIPDDTQLDIPLRFRRMETMSEQLQRLVDVAVSQRAEAVGMETFDEADDFDVEDDYDPRSRYELDTSEMLYDRNAGWSEDQERFIRERIQQREKEALRADVENERSAKGSKRSKQKSGKHSSSGADED